MDIKDIKDLIITIDKTSIEQVEIEKQDIKIIISKSILDRDKSTKLLNQSDEIANITSENELVETKVDDDIFIIKSPIVGTFYRASSPDSPPLINQGDLVELGQTICIIEAMKSMNEIKSDVSGHVIEFLVNNEDIVEFGQPLLKVRRY